MLHTKFQASEQSGSEEEVFLIFFLCISMVRNKDPLLRGNLGSCGLDLNKLSKRLLGSATYQILSI